MESQTHTTRFNFWEKDTTKTKREKQVIKTKKKVEQKRDSTERDHKIVPYSWSSPPEGRPEHAL